MCGGVITQINGMVGWGGLGWYSVTKKEESDVFLCPPYYYCDGINSRTTAAVGLRLFRVAFVLGGCSEWGWRRRQGGGLCSSS